MQNDRRASIFVVVIFLAVIMAPGLYQTVAELVHGEKPGALDVFGLPPTAENLHAYEQSLEETSLVVKGLRPKAQYLEWKFLADPGEKAVLGRDGWLFYRPNLRYLIDRSIDVSEKSGSPLAAIRSFHDELLASGIRLLVVPVPSKESVYPELLARRAENARVIIAEPTRRLLEELKRESIEYVDLFEIFEHAKQEAEPVAPRPAVPEYKTRTGRRRVHAWLQPPSQSRCSGQELSIAAPAITSSALSA